VSETAILSRERALNRLDDMADLVGEAVIFSPCDDDGPIYDFTGPRVERRRRPYTPDEIIAALRSWDETFGHPPTMGDWNPAKRRQWAAQCIYKARNHLKWARLWEEGPWPSVNTVRAHFGSMNRALAAAGFMPRPAGRQPKIATDPLRLQAKASGAVASEARFCHLVTRLTEAGHLTADDRQALWYELAELAVVLGDRAGEDLACAA
jgi:hypothetical protein